MIIVENKVGGLSPEALGRFVLRARRAVRLAGTVNILLTGDAEMRSLNLRFRKKNKTTDVLSFPSDSLATPSGKRACAGEIAISSEVARRNAAKLGHSAAVEVKILALHGILHLTGFDHERDNGEMSRKEANLRRLLSLPSSLTERGQPQQRTSEKLRGRLRSNKGRRTA
ncbi:MAG TPA: rRNA maturation RNase YbeY [Candidatus Sulfotelmatobacter sp.]|nr:rRNA maturation RNase YbeY [Candidatus Sulfotelmatobacter sp.]